MAVQNLSFDDFSEDELAGQRLVEPGSYHAAVRGIDDSLLNDATGYHVDLEVLAGATERDPTGQSGLHISERLSTSQKASKRIYAFLRATGVIGNVAGQSGVTVDFQDAVGRELIIDVIADKFTGRDGNEVETRSIAFLGFRALPVDAAASVSGDDFDL